MNVRGWNFLNEDTQSEGLNKFIGLFNHVRRGGGSHVQKGIKNSSLDMCITLRNLVARLVLYFWVGLYVN